MIIKTDYLVTVNLTLEQLSAIQGFMANKPVIRVYLFGSRARNQARSDSDIDLLVDLDYSQKIGLEFIEMQIELEELLHLPVDLVSSNGVSKWIKPTIDREKRLIYAREN